MTSLIRNASIALLVLGTAFASCAHAEDASVKSRLDSRGVKYEVDGDGDFKVT